MIAVIGALVGAPACKNEKSKLDLDPVAKEKPAASAAQQPTVEAPNPAAQAFCEKTLQKVLDCFNDEAFWDVFATAYFAKYPDTTGNPDAKKMWIGIRKDDIVGLKKDGQLAQNCTTMVRGMRNPTDADMAPVTAAMAKSCTDFGTAMGFMLFHKGVFHEPR